MDEQVTTDLRFSIVPEWVLDAELSDRAIRIYALIARYADNDTLQAFPARETLAKRAGCHVKSVDRAIVELVNAGALIKEHRKMANAYSSNLYTVRRIPSHLGTGMSPPRDTAVPTLGTGESPPRDTGVALTITTELEPIEQEPLNDIPKPEKRMTRLPEDWQPNQRLLEMFATKWPDLDADFQVDNFINYWLGAGTRKADWGRTFQVWMNNNQQKAKKRPRGQYSDRMTNNQKAALLAIQMRREAEETKALEAPTNEKQSKELEGEVSSWMKGIDDV